MRRLFPFFLIVLEFAGNISNDMYLPALPEIARVMGVSANMAQLTVATWFTGGAALLWLIGPLSDRYGRRLILLTGGTLFCLSSIGCAMATHAYWLIFFRFFQGMSVSGTMIVGYATLNEIYNDEEATTLMAWMGISSIIAPLIGPLMGGAVMLIAPWQAIFWILAILGVLSIGGLARSFPFCTIEHDPKALHLGRLLDVYKSILANKRFTFASILYGLGFSSTMSWIVISPSLLMNGHGYTPLQYAMWQIPVFTLFSLGAICTKPLIRRYTRPRVIRFFLCWSFALALILIVFSFFAPVPILVSLVTLVLLGRGVTFAPISRIILSIFAIRRGAATAMFYFITVGISALITSSYALLPNSFTVLGIALALLASGSLLMNHLRMHYEREGGEKSA